MISKIQISDADIDEFLVRYNAALTDGKQLLEFDDKRREALTGWDDLQACPGSGKTTLIAAKLMILARKWKSKYRGICVLTHTNVACNEIMSRLEKDSYGYKLLSYPHFIGTIQEFIDRYIGLPITRSLGFYLRLFSVDDFEMEFKKIWWGKFTDKKSHKKYQFNYYLMQKKIFPAHFSLIYSDGDLVVNPIFKKKFESLIDFDKDGTVDDFLFMKKTQYLSKGVALYRDMYDFSKFILTSNTDLAATLCLRFPLVFLDEMQDTQKFQDELINSVFEYDNVKIQRFGDPDQAIFDNMGGEEPNKTFNDNNELSILKHSHRFSEDIARKISNLSYSQIGDIQALTIPRSPYQHTVIVYDDNSRNHVLNVFAEIVADNDKDNIWKTIKAVGATEGQGEHISAYWGKFDRRKSVKSPKPERLLDIVGRKWWKHDEGSGKQYKLIVEGVLDVLRIGDFMDTSSDVQRYFNINSLKNWLRENGKYIEFRELVTGWILSDIPSDDQWSNQIINLKNMFGIGDIEVVNTYLSYNNVGEVDDIDCISGNVFHADNNREIEVGTIHSVKGETHDATLVMETKNHEDDIEQMLNHITGIDSGKVTGKRKIKSTRQLYVAFSRPRHLLCFAVHRDHMSEKQNTDLKQSGWSVKLIYDIAG